MDLSPRLVEILGYLASRPGEIIPKDVLLGRFWQDVHVTENTVLKGRGGQPELRLRARCDRERVFSAVRADPSGTVAQSRIAPGCDRCQSSCIGWRGLGDVDDVCAEAGHSQKLDFSALIRTDALPAPATPRSPAPLDLHEPSAVDNALT